MAPLRRRQGAQNSVSVMLLFRFLVYSAWGMLRNHHIHAHIQDVLFHWINKPGSSFYGYRTLSEIAFAGIHRCWRNFIAFFFRETIGSSIERVRDEVYQSLTMYSSQVIVDVSQERTRSFAVVQTARERIYERETSRSCWFEIWFIDNDYLVEPLTRGSTQ